MTSIVARLIALTRAVAGALFFGLLLCVAAGVVSRYVFNAPLTFTDEVAGYLFAGSALLGMAVTAFHGGHIRVDVLVSRLHAARQRRIEAAHWLISVAYVAVLFASGLLFVWNAQTRSLRAPTVLQTPIALVGIVFPVAMALFLLERLTAARRGGRPDQMPPERGGGL